MTHAEQTEKFSNPQKVCDIVMKGGITSGVVYPLALVSLAEDYRFSSIGGTSAGAMAAVAVAAAEYGRQTADGGFGRLAKVPDEVGNLLAFFQPTPALKPLFDMLVAALKGKSGLGKWLGVARAAVVGYWKNALLGAGVGLFVVLIAVMFKCGFGLVAFGALLALVGVFCAVVWRLYKALHTELPANDFGLCPGTQQTCAGGDGFTDWLAKLIDEAAGLGQDPEAPLTFGDLAKPKNGHEPIHLAMMTTSLMERRPYTLPMENNGFVFEQREWAKIFPKRIMDFLIRECDPFEPLRGEEGTFFCFPDDARLPIVVAARMSLSFPGLISAVPLWRRDYTFTSPDDQNQLRRCLFSDGGLSSNFPIHFFDHLLPNSPTFAISLDEFDPKKSRGGNVWLPTSAHGGIQIPVQPFEGLGGFLLRLIDSAKDWQDNLQSILPGYRERIVHIGLKPDEGGLNLTMDEAKIRKLVGYGKVAGEKLRKEFSLDLHRWRRFLVAMARMEETLDEVATAYKGTPGGGEDFHAFLTRYAENPGQYKQDESRLAAMLRRGNKLAAMGTDWRQEPKIRDGRIPKPETDLRISPKP
ncbi:MAG: patatin-like phospholipase family protein [Methylocystis sp.]|nr:patatin-like phospholipase family protein [Methylocystis sp.]